MRTDINFPSQNSHHFTISKIFKFDHGLSLHMLFLLTMMNAHLRQLHYEDFETNCIQAQTANIKKCKFGDKDEGVVGLSCYLKKETTKTEFWIYHSMVDDEKNSWLWIEFPGYCSHVQLDGFG